LDGFLVVYDVKSLHDYYFLAVDIHFCLMHRTTATYQINRLSEHRRYNATLHQVALFPRPSAHRVAAIQGTSSAFRSATLSFRFGAVNYAKGRVLPFFRALELITGQKGVAILSRRAVPARKVRKGGLVGCRVTLRRRALVSVLETLGLSLPQMERFSPPRWTARLRTGVANPLERSSRSIRAFRFGELVAIPPLERGLGLHPDVQTVHLSVRPQRRFREDAYFLLRTAKLPVL
jgi:hypothetical protein